MKRTIRFLALSLSMALICCVSFGQNAEDEEEWQEFEYRGRTYYVMPDEVMRKLGLEVADLPDERNAAVFLLNAHRQFKDYAGDWHNIEWLTYEPWTAAEHPEIAAWLEENDQAFEILDKALSLDESSFPVLMSKPGNPVLLKREISYLATNRSMARALSIRAALRLGEGRIDESIEDGMRILRFAHHASLAGSLIDGLVGNTLALMGTNALEVALVNGDFEPVRLAEIQERLSAARAYLPDPVLMFGGEKIVGLNAFDYMVYGEHSLLMDNDNPVRPNEAMKSLIYGRAWRIVFPDRTMRAELMAYYDGAIAEAAEPIRPELEDHFVVPDFKYYNAYAFLLMPAVSTPLDRLAGLRASLDCAIQGVAVMRYRAVNGEYPDALNDLLPDYLDELPLDPFTGKQFRYSTDDDGFVVYSIGWNRVDNGGRARQGRLPGDDIVFRIQAD